MVQSDALLRRADHIAEEDTNNEDKTILADKLFVKTIDTELQGALVSAIMKDDLVNDALRALKNNRTPPIKSALEDWKFEDGLLFFKDRCYVPQDETLCQAIIQKYHDSIMTGHPG